MAAEVSVLLVRHGEAAASWDTHVDPSLSAAGQAQAAALLPFFAHRTPCRLVSSPLQRAQETAAPLGGHWGLPVAIEDRVRELPSGTVPMDERRAWLHGVMQSNWTEVDATLHAWRERAWSALLECREPREQDIWMHSLLNVARATNPYLAPDEAAPVWARFMAAPCFGTLRDYQRRWIELHAALAARDGRKSAALATEILATQADLNRDAREYLLIAGMAGHLSVGERSEAMALWTRQEPQLRNPDRPVLRLLRCHADAAACATAFAGYAD